jgi:hypothetical protein
VCTDCDSFGDAFNSLITLGTTARGKIPQHYIEQIDKTDYCEHQIIISVGNVQINYSCLY